MELEKIDNCLSKEEIIALCKEHNVDAIWDSLEYGYDLWSPNWWTGSIVATLPASCSKEQVLEVLNGI